jgi:hypothetical protein
MKITASHYPLTVQYKAPGKLYNTGNDSEPGIPFDEQYLNIGESFDVIGELIAVREHTGVAPDNTDPSGGHGS